MLEAEAETAGMVEDVDELTEQIGDYKETGNMVTVENVFVKIGD
jgi:hypothetical protein